MDHKPSCTARPQDPTPLTLADIVRAHGDELGPVSPAQARALADIAACRTAELGGHRSLCDACGFEVVSFNSCRNRHCPQCQALDQVRWMELREADLLPVDYFHPVFTIASELHDLFLYNQTVAYGLLFSAATASLVELAGEPRFLGATIGVMAVLHTWTQTLGYHPHIHCIVPGGGPSLDGSRWVSPRHEFFLPVRALATLFRGKLLSALEKALAKGQMAAPPGSDPRRALKRAARKKWNVYIKPPFRGPKYVIRYLGRYTHRIAISNRRLVSLKDGEVTFRYKDRSDADRTKTMTLPAEQFLRRFLLHVVPSGFVRIRYFGGLANCTRKRWLEQARRLLAASGVNIAPPAATPPEQESWQELLLRLTGLDITRCPRCKAGRLAVVERFESRRKARPFSARAPPT